MGIGEWAARRPWADQADRLVTGGWALAHRGGSWLRADGDWRVSVPRYAVSIPVGALVCYVGGYTIWAEPRVLWLLSGSYCVAAWRAGAPSEPQEQGEHDGAEDSEQPEPEAPADPLPDILDDLIGEARGVHLRTIVQHLHESRLDTSCKRTDVRAALERRGIPVRPSVKVAGRVNEGVHRDDLTDWLDAPATAAADAGPGAVATPATTGLTSNNYPDATAPTTPSAGPERGREKGFAAPDNELERHITEAISLTH